MAVPVRVSSWPQINLFKNIRIRKEYLIPCNCMQKNPPPKKKQLHKNTNVQLIRGSTWHFSMQWGHLATPVSSPRDIRHIPFLLTKIANFLKSCLFNNERAIDCCLEFHSIRRFRLKSCNKCMIHLSSSLILLEDATK